MFSQGDNGWQQIVDPNTGKPFQSYDAYAGWAKGMEGAAGASGADAQKAAAAAGPSKNAEGSYDWTKSVGYYYDPKSGMYYFGNEAPNAGLGTNPNGLSVPYEDPNYAYEAGALGTGGEGGTGHSTTYVPGYGYIDPHTGKITWNTGDQWSHDKLGTSSSDYNAWQDYGLGSASLGVIPIVHDATGAPTAYYVGVAGGGGKVVTDLTEAQMAAEEYRAWRKEQAQRTAGGTGGTGTGGTGTSGPGELTVPGQGEDFWNRTMGDYLAGPTNAKHAFGDKPNQPTNAEQYWNQWSGKFQNPDELKGTFDRAEQKAQTTLNRKSSSQGWSDSSAAAKATANIGMDFNDRYVKAMQDFATTGMGLAGAADTAHSQQLKDWLAEVAAAQGIDNLTLQYLVQGQGAAGAAQVLKENRLNGGFDRSLQIANNMAAIASAGLSSASQQSIAMQMAQLQAQMTANQMSYDMATAQLNEYMKTMGLSAQAMSIISQAWASKNGKNPPVVGPVPGA